MFNKEYWLSSANKLKDTKYLTLMALFIALKVMAEVFFDVKIAENLFISLSFIFASVEACIIGPVAGLVSGAVTDIVSFLLNSKGYAFFPGYTLSAMLGMFVFGIFLYRQKITILRLFLAKLCINLFVNALLGSVWSAMMMSKGYIYYFTQSIIKNSILLPIEVTILVLLFNLLIPVLERKNLIIKQEALPIKFK